MSSQTPQPTPDASPLVATWTNADRKTACLGQVRIENTSGTLRATAYPALGDADTAFSCDVTGYLNRPQNPVYEALTARAHHDGSDILLEGNLNAGLLVLSCYTSKPGQPHGSFFAREYFSRGERDFHSSVAQPPITDGDALFHGLEQPATFSIAKIEGRWKNANAASGLIDALTITAQDQDIAVSARGRDGADWNETPARLFTDVVHGSVSGVAANAIFKLGSSTVQIQIRETKGVLVAAIYTQFSDGRPGLFNRDFFYRQ